MNSVIFLDEGHIGIMLFLVLSPGQIDPRHQTINEQTKRVLVHIERLSLCPWLLVVVDIVQIDSFHPVTKIVLVYVAVA